MRLCIITRSMKTARTLFTEAFALVALALFVSMVLAWVAILS